MMVEPEVRTAVDEVSREVAMIAGSDGPERRLVAAWGRLVVALAIEPAPALRTCPHCGGEGMRAATRCGSCWAELTPPA